MSIRFELGPGGTNAFNYANRRAAARQTQAQRDAIYQKYQRLVGRMFPNQYVANVAAEQELKQLPEYWDEDTQPRLPLNLQSEMLSSIVPSSGGVFIYFRSNPGKGYYYPAGASTAETAKRVEQLVTSPDIEKAYAGWWAKMNGGRR